MLHISQRINKACSLDKSATCGYNFSMTTVSIRDAKNRLTELARQVEKGETITVTRNGLRYLTLCRIARVAGCGLRQSTPS